MGDSLISSKLEKFTKENVFSDLSKGDPLWDIPHTQAVVHHLKEILQYSPGLDVDSTVLIIAAYGHDWGYSKYYKSGKSLTKDEYMEAKKSHARVAYQKMEELLKDEVYKELTNIQKDKILHLILVHDQLESLKDPEELLLMEADTLGGLDTDFVTSTWTKEQDINHMESVRRKRLPFFITQHGKHKFEECFNKRMKKALSRPE